MNFSSSTLFASVLWSGVASGYVIYGWKQKDGIPLFAGIAMTAVSWLITSALLMSVVSVVLMAAVYWLKKNF